MGSRKKKKTKKAIVDMERRVTLFLYVSWGVLQWAIVATCLIIFYPCKILLRGYAGLHTSSTKIEIIIPVSEKKVEEKASEKKT